MLIAEVIGTVVSTRKTTNIDGLPLRIVRKVSPLNAAATDTYMVAVDVVGADEGELVLVTSGSAARNTHLTDARPVDAVIMAIIDLWQIDDVVLYGQARGE